MSKPQRIEFDESPYSPPPSHAGARRADRRATLIAFRAQMGELRFESRCDALPREARYDEPLPIWDPDPAP